MNRFALLVIMLVLTGGVMAQCEAEIVETPLHVEEEGIRFLKQETVLYPESEKYISRIIKQLEQ